MSARFMTACFLLLIVSFAFSQTDDKMAPQGSRTGCPSMAQVPAAPESAPAKLKPQINCPVVGGQIDKKHYVDYQGKRIYRCCPGCKEGVAKDPEKALGYFIRALKETPGAEQFFERLACTLTMKESGFMYAAPVASASCRKTPPNIWQSLKSRGRRPRSSVLRRKR